MVTDGNTIKWGVLDESFLLWVSSEIAGPQIRWQMIKVFLTLNIQSKTPKVANLLEQPSHQYLLVSYISNFSKKHSNILWLKQDRSLFFTHFRIQVGGPERYGDLKMLRAQAPSILLLPTLLIFQLIERVSMGSGRYASFFEMHESEVSCITST